MASLGKGLAAANLVMAALFGVAAGLQYNDPDRWVWIAVYTGAALVCVFYGRVRGGKLAAALLGAIAAAWGGVLLARVIGVIDPADVFLEMGQKGGAVEVGREAGGLAIVAVWMLVLLVVRKRRGSKQ